MKAKSVMFSVELCDKCRNDKISGDNCIKCKLDKVIKAKVDLNIELIEKIDHLEAQLEEANEAIKKGMDYFTGLDCPSSIYPLKSAKRDRIEFERMSRVCLEKYEVKK
jgi:uncharacterized NAD-dependent epimerase/dehydratase family protein